MGFIIFIFCGDIYQSTILFHCAVCQKIHFAVFSDTLLNFHKIDKYGKTFRYLLQLLIFKAQPVTPNNLVLRSLYTYQSQILKYESIFSFILKYLTKYE